eukprot:CAMPEP_0194200602 /NCGR_PEP_ID=MMETSP0156-20130528/1134_1 /TAXON_ID=33649 /ORGANISM="Thalassionema nitzschioides, Strain L26-B" /LENGTH=423 /DNA_ID=CAMNT_0038925615 /DNA_START=117 /DNA_END=1385 /DNA_ORIENTATION=+
MSETTDHSSPVVMSSRTAHRSVRAIRPANLESSRRQQQPSNEEEDEGSEDDEDYDVDEDYDCDCCCSECEDDDDGSSCSCEECSRHDHANSFLNFLHASMMMQMEIAGDDDGGGDDDDDDDSSSCGSMPPLFNKDGEVVGEEEQEDPDAPKCAICFSTRKSLENLPCCGGNAEESSSTRFCRACLVKSLKSQTMGEDGFMFGRNAKETFVGECPRCRRLIAITRRGCDGISCAKFEDAVQFVFDKEFLRKHLFTMAYANPYHIPKDIFLAFDGTSSSDTAVDQLIQWRILKRTKKVDLYTMDASDQTILRKFMSRRRNRPSFDSEDDVKWRKAALLVVAQAHFEAMMFAVFTGFKVFRAIRLMNHTMVLFWMAYEYVPPPPISSHLWIVNCLNAFVACLIMMVAIVVAAGATVGWLAARCVRW